MCSLTYIIQVPVTGFYYLAETALCHILKCLKLHSFHADMDNVRIIHIRLYKNNVFKKTKLITCCKNNPQFRKLEISAKILENVVTPVIKKSPVIT